MPLTSIRSLSRTGRPCAGPRTLPSRRSLSSAAASLSAFWLSCVTAFRPGPRLFSAAIRAMYWRVSSTDVSSPRAIIAVAVGPSSVSRSSGSAATAGAAQTTPSVHVNVASRASLIPIPLGCQNPGRDASPPEVGGTLDWRSKSLRHPVANSPEAGAQQHAGRHQEACATKRTWSRCTAPASAPAASSPNSSTSRARRLPGRYAAAASDAAT